MRKTTIAIILLLSVTVVFGQEVKIKDGVSAIYSFTDFDKKKHYSDFQTYYKYQGGYHGFTEKTIFPAVNDTQRKKPATKKPVVKKEKTYTDFQAVWSKRKYYSIYIIRDDWQFGVLTDSTNKFKGVTITGDTAKFMAEFPTEFSRKGTEANSFGGTSNTAMITIEDADEVVIGDQGVIVKDTIPKRDTIRIHDTIQVPVYLVDVTDTVPATVLYKKSEKSDRIYTVKGFALVRGFKVFVQGKAQWADKPQIVGALDDKKRLIKNVIQVL